MKKEYLTPTCRIIALRNQILAGSVVGITISDEEEYNGSFSAKTENVWEYEDEEEENL